MNIRIAGQFNVSVTIIDQSNFINFKIGSQIILTQFEIEVQSLKTIRT